MRKSVKLSFNCKLLGSVPADDNDCCYQKTVGPDSYTLVDTTAAVPAECINTCVYQRDGQPGEQFCFKTGDLPVNCISKQFKLINKYPGSNFSGNITYSVNFALFVDPYTVGENGTFIFAIPSETIVQTITAEGSVPGTCVSFDGPTSGTTFDIFFVQLSTLCIVNEVMI